ncbi:MAG: hypothetical protein HY053_00710, partial [Proteobacteria bacterium]|nr:hypothetical protein [Pseudomonadota bacterium]
MPKTVIDPQGKYVTSDQVALIEVFNSTTSRGRLIYGNSFLIRQPIAEFVRRLGFRFLGAPDGIATNPGITYRVEPFDLAKAREVDPGFKSQRPFATRLSWGKGGEGESVYLEAAPDAVAD